jgi:hypothetical protein
MVPTCDDIPIYNYEGFEQDLDLKCSMQVLQLSFIFFFDRT